MTVPALCVFKKIMMIWSKPHVQNLGFLPLNRILKPHGAAVEPLDIGQTQGNHRMGHGQAVEHCGHTTPAIDTGTDKDANLVQ